MIVSRATVGDAEGALVAARIGLGAARSGHLPLAALRIRAALLTVLRQSSCAGSSPARLAARLRTALIRPLPPLLEHYLTSACEDVGSRVTNQPPARGHVMSDLPHFLEISQTAADDGAAARGVCDALCQRTRAAAIVIIVGTSSVEIVAQTGRT